MRRLAVILLTCAALGASAATASAASLGFAVDDGFVAAQTGNVAPAETLGAALGRLNATWVRVDVRWNVVATRQPTNGRLAKDAAYDWTSVDDAVRAARAVTLPQTAPQGPPQILFSIGGTPDWARSDGGSGGSPGDPAWAPRRSAFQNFVAAVAARYAKADSGLFGNVAAAFEIWPNPNSAAGLRPQRDAGRLVAPGLLKVLVKVATTEIRKVTAVPIVTGGLARTDPANPSDTPSIAFLRALARTRVQADAIGMRLQPPSGVEAPADPGNLALSDPGTIIANVDAYFPNQGKGIWETGYGLSGAADPAVQVAGVTAFLNAALNPRFGPAIWSNLVDTAAAPGGGLFAAASPLTPPGKQAWTTWTTIVPPPAPPA